MISIADLNRLRENPVTAYPEYRQIRAAARSKAMLPVDPSEITVMWDVIRRRGADWCTRVLGYPMPPSGLGGISGTDADMLVLADDRNLDPAEPAWLTLWKAESAGTRRQQEEAREAGRQRDQARWAAALATCGVDVEVRPNVNGRRYRTGWADGPLRHTVPKVAARSAKRRHAAGRALCESARRPRPLQLAEATDAPATCMSCIRYTAEIKADDSRP